MRYLRNRPTAAQPVIELKPTIVVSPPANEKRSRWQTASSIVGTVVPSVIAAIALFLSVLAYQDQRRVNSDQITMNSIVATDAERQEAGKVAFWYTYSRPNELIVQNLGVQLKVFLSFGSRKQYTTSWTPLLGTVPPCSRFSIRLSDLEPTGLLVDVALQQNGQISATENLGNPTGELSFPVSMVFTDANGLTWARSSIGTLTPSHPLSKPLDVEDQSRYQPQVDTGCT
jgi:hypothetical protein